jgi:chromosome segregation ATPase
LSEKESEIAKLAGQLDERSTLADSQKIEIVALKTKVEALKERITDAGNEIKALEDRRDAERLEFKHATEELATERGRVENLGRRIAELEQHLAAQTKEAELFGRRAQDLENRLAEQAQLLHRSAFELNQMRGEVEVARKTEGDLRTAIIELEGRANSVTEKLKLEKVQLQSEIDRTADERDRLARDLGKMKRESEEAWASERVENASLRERISDVAAEVARLASALEGPNSPINAILAAETVRDRTGTASRNDDVNLSETPSTNGDLADRIRALQTHASRLPRPNTEPTSRN